MKDIKKAVMAVAGVLAISVAHMASAQETLKLGISAPMSGSAAVWGLGLDWLAKQAAKAVNDSGGVKAGGKTYLYEVIAYDNKYNAADGAKVAQTLLNRDNVRYVIAAVGTAPAKAIQSLSERKGALLFTTAWGKSMKGPGYPLTFTQINTPVEVLGPLYAYVKQQHPAIKTVAMLNPNDATGKESEQEARKFWEANGVKVVGSDWYERGTTEFQPIAAKLVDMKPDVIDLGTAPAGDAGTVFKEIKVLGWNGVKVVAAGTSAEAMIKIGGSAADDVYMGLAGDYAGPQATPVQRELNKGLRAAVGEPINVVQMGGYDAVMALKAAMEAANSIDPKAVAAALPKVVFESSYGKSAFGGKDAYGSSQQILVPVIVTQVKGGKLVELKRVIPEELKRRLPS
jgi:branched-chain amino acid transport system substrate-binding protein